MRCYRSKRCVCTFKTESNHRMSGFKVIGRREAIGREQAIFCQEQWGFQVLSHCSHRWHLWATAGNSDRHILKGPTTLVWSQVGETVKLKGNNFSKLAFNGDSASKPPNALYAFWWHLISLDGAIRCTWFQKVLFLYC